MPTSLAHSYRSSAGVYYFRYVWPARIRDIYSDLGREFRCSLNTRSRDIAKNKISLRIFYLNKMVEVLFLNKYNKNGCVEYNMFCALFEGVSLISLSTVWEDIQCSGPSLKGRLNMILRYLEHRHADGGVTIFDGDQEAEIDSLAKLMAKKALYERLYAQELMGKEVDRALVSSGGMAEAKVTDRPLEVSEPIFPPQVPPASGQALGEGNSKAEVCGGDVGEEGVVAPVTVQALIDDFVGEMEDNGQLDNAGTRRKYIAQLRSIAEMLGADTALKSLNTQSIVVVKKQISRYPNRRFVGRKASIPLAELMAQENIRPISKKTAKGYFELLKNLTKYAAENGYMEHDIAASVELKMPKKRSSNKGEAGGDQDKDKRPPFSDKDLKQLFSGYVYGGEYRGKKRNLLPAHFWVPLISLYSGLRINEACQLMVSDIQQEPVAWHGQIFDIPRIRVTDRHPDQVIKTANSVREVPIHSKLIELGFLEFVEKRRRAVADPVNERLFEGMQWEDSSRWGRVISRWFNGDITRPGYITERLGADRDKKVFHSFRHTVADMLRNGGVAEFLCIDLLGHESDTTTSGYGDGFQLGMMKDAIDKIQYSAELDAQLSKLSFAEFERFARTIRLRPDRPSRSRR